MHNVYIVGYQEHSQECISRDNVLRTFHDMTSAVELSRLHFTLLDVQGYRRNITVGKS